LLPDYYHAPALILTVLLLPAFGYLYARYRESRTLYWLLGFSWVVVSRLLIDASGMQGLSAAAYSWLSAAGQATFLAGTALFLGSFSPQTFRVGRFRVLYVVAFMAPLIAYAILIYGVYRGDAPQGLAFLIFPALGTVSYVVSLFWSGDRYVLPKWVGLATCLVLGAASFWICFVVSPDWSLTFVESSILLMTALLAAVAYRRFSPGVVLSVTGFVAWSLTILVIFPAVANNPAAYLHIIQVASMGKVVAAVGMILLALEHQLALNRTTEERERRALAELDVYARLSLAQRRVEDFDRQGSEICAAVTEHSRFSQAALLLLDKDGLYRLAGSAGFDTPTARTLEDMAPRIHPNGFLAAGSATPAVAQSQAVILDLEPWLWPGHDPQRFGLTQVLAVPMINRAAAEGALLVTGMRPVRSDAGSLTVIDEPEPLRLEDVLPIEMLAGRIQAARSQTMMFEKLIDSERFGHLGHLAANVTQQLNNPLTVILGYASLLEGTSPLIAQDRKAVESILAEARQMRATLDSLQRIARPQGDQLTAVSVAELLTDLGELHRPDFLHRSIEFRMILAPNLPRAICSAQQLRQAVRHCLQFAMHAVEGVRSSAGEPRTVRLEALHDSGKVQIVVTHSGPGFVSPERVFDPYAPPLPSRESAGLGLSLCASIMRENEGRASAVNLEPRGAAIILELKAA